MPAESHLILVNFFEKRRGKVLNHGAAHTTVFLHHHQFVPHQQVRSRLQLSEVKCEKMLIKLKSFKEKNEKLQLSLDEADRHADHRVHEARRGAEEQLQALHTRLRDVETHNGQLIHENNTLKETASQSLQVTSLETLLTVYSPSQPLSCTFVIIASTSLFFTLAMLVVTV